MRTLRVKDNQPLKKKDIAKIPKLTKKIAGKTLEKLEREGLFLFPALAKDSADLGNGQMIIERSGDLLCTGNIMGFIGLEDERLEITSRFGGDSDYFSRYLLEKVVDYPNIINTDYEAEQDSRMFNLMVFLFPCCLKAALRKGIFKRYTRIKYNDSNVKGSIDVARHIKTNTPFTGNIAYGQREFSHDNYLTELLRHTIEYIKGKPFGKILLGNVKDEIKLINAATPRYNPLNRQRIIELNTKNVVQHAFFREYLTLQRLCVCILQQRRHRLGSGSRQAKGIIFDGAWLWEEYVASLIGEYFYHPMNKSGKGAQYLFDGNTGLIYPDFIGKNPEARIIADAKYKPSENIGDRDYLQLLAYMFRFDSKQGFFIYPESGENEGTELRMNRGVTFEHSVLPRNDITVTKLGLQLPSDAGSYESFAARIRESEKRFIRTIIRQS